MWCGGACAARVAHHQEVRRRAAQVARQSPLVALAQLAWIAVQNGSIGEAAGLLLLYGVVFFVLAIFAYRREERHTFG